MGNLLLLQLLTFGIPTLSLLALVGADWKFPELFSHWKLDQVLFPALFVFSLIMILGMPSFPPQETTKALVFLAPLTMIKLLLRDHWGGIVLTEMTLLNVALGFVYYPLFETLSWVSILLQIGGMNVLVFTFLKFGNTSPPLLKTAIHVGVLLVEAAIILWNGSFTIALLLGVCAIPVGVLGLYAVLRKQTVSSLKLAFFELSIPLILIAEFYHYVL